MRFSELEGRRLGVWGAGREISSFARQLAERLPAAEIAVAAFDEPPAAEQVQRACLGLSSLEVVDAGEAEAALSRVRGRGALAGSLDPQTRAGER